MMAQLGESHSWSPRAGLPRWVEVAAATVGMLVCTPLMAVAAVAVRLSSPGPVLFRQVRVGRGGRPFTMYKFRTMVVHEGGRQVTAGGDPRITRVGRWLRRVKLDELPELWNVVRGDMSLVGPRPEVPRYVDLDSPMWRTVLAVRPGITDPVTVRLRNEEELLRIQDGDPEVFYREALQPAKLRGYIEYLRGRTAWKDIVVLWTTFLAVVGVARVRAGVSEGVEPLAFDSPRPHDS